MPTRLPRYSRTPTPLKILIGRPEHLFMQALGRFRYLTAEQFTRLLYGTNVLPYVRKHLTELYHARYIERVFPPIEPGQGSSKAVYCLDQKGYDYLKERGLAPEGRFRASEEKKRALPFQQHTEKANDLMITAHLLPKSDARVRITRWKSERELKLTPIRIPLADQTIGLVPDGWGYCPQGGLG
jgi:hypothetical protein